MAQDLGKRSLYCDDEVENQVSHFANLRTSTSRICPDTSLFPARVKSRRLAISSCRFRMAKGINSLKPVRSKPFRARGSGLALQHLLPVATAQRQRQPPASTLCAQASVCPACGKPQNISFLRATRNLPSACARECKVKPKWRQQAERILATSWNDRHRRHTCVGYKHGITMAGKAHPHPWRAACSPLLTPVPR